MLLKIWMRFFGQQINQLRRHRTIRIDSKNKFSHGSLCLLVKKNSLKITWATGKHENFFSKLLNQFLRESFFFQFRYFGNLTWVTNSIAAKLVLSPMLFLQSCSVPCFYEQKYQIATFPCAFQLKITPGTLENLWTTLYVDRNAVHVSSLVAL